MRIACFAVPFFPKKFFTFFHFAIDIFIVGSILQPFCNAVEQCLRCASVCLLTGDARDTYIQENENDRIMLGQQIGKYQKGELKNMLSNDILNNLEQANTNRRNVSHNYIDKSIGELESQKEIFYTVIKEITIFLKKSGKI